jgi:hypothetical protein
LLTISFSSQSHQVVQGIAVAAGAERAQPMGILLAAAVEEGGDVEIIARSFSPIPPHKRNIRNIHNNA